MKWFSDDIRGIIREVTGYVMRHPQYSRLLFWVALTRLNKFLEIYKIKTKIFIQLESLVDGASAKLHVETNENLKITKMNWVAK